MAWFRRSSGAMERKELNRLHQEQATEGTAPLPEEAQELLDKAMGLLWKKGASPGSRHSMLIDDYVYRHTIQAIGQWFTVKDDGIDISDPGISTDTLDFLQADKDVKQKVTNRLCQADVDSWVFIWWVTAESLPWKNRTALGEYTPAPGQQLPNGSIEHRVRFDALRKFKAEKERSVTESKRISELEAIANRTPIGYESDSDTLVVVDEKSIYSVFALQLRQEGLNESDVFDVLHALSELIHQSVSFVPKLTGPVVRQLEGRVLLSFYVRNRQARELTEATAKEKAAIRDTQRYVAFIFQGVTRMNPAHLNDGSSRTSTSVLSSVVDVTSKVAREAIISALQAAMKSMLVH